MKAQDKGVRMMKSLHKTGLATAATAALAIGMLATPQSAKAETCVLATNAGQINNYSSNSG
jgi:hypothetical protein